MEYVATVLVLFVAIEHVYILVMEMFLWTTPRTLKVFGLTKELAESTKALAANQGLYNGFLAAGLFWGLLHSYFDNSSSFGFQIQIFFLLCVLVAAIFGSFTVKRSILIVQGLPGLLAICALWLSA